MPRSRLLDPRRARRGSLTPLAALLLGGCTLPPPTLAGGGTTPQARSDLSLGLTNDPESGRSAPLLQVRHGLSRDADVGLTLSGSGGEATLRGRRLLNPEGSTRLSLGLGAGLGALSHAEASWAGLFDGAAWIGLTSGGIYEAWFGPRLLLWYTEGRIRPRPGVTVGMAIGFRRLHGLIELNVLTGGGQPDGPFTALAWQPTLALRLRL